MVVLEVGRVCLKTSGREAGKYCVVVKPMDKSFVMVTGPKLLTGVKRRRSNIDHLQITEHVIKITADANDEAVIAAYESAGLVKQLNLKKPSAASMKTEAEKAQAKPKEQKKAGKKADKKSDKAKK